MVNGPDPTFVLERTWTIGSTFRVELGSVEGAPCVRKRPISSASAKAFGELTPCPVERERRALDALARSGLGAFPRLIACGHDDAGAFVVETFVEGEPLERLVDVLGTPLPGRLGLHLAHRLVALFESLRDERAGPGAEGFVHGDPSPGNVVVRPGNDVALIDFGSAGLTRGDRPFEATGRGTVPYAAPELCRGEVHPSTATDRYAVAALVARVLAGDALIPRLSSAALIVAIGDRGLALSELSAVGLPAALERSLHAHLAFDPVVRPPSLADLREALDILARA